MDCRGCDTAVLSQREMYSGETARVAIRVPRDGFPVPGSMGSMDHRIACGNGWVKLVILDRDGVINEALPHQVRSVEEWRPIPGSLDAIARLSRAGCRVVVATRQPGLRRRHFTFEDLNRIHEHMHGGLAEYGGTIDGIFLCLCLPRHDCECFKPHASMPHAIAERLHGSLAGVPYVGATPDVLEAARAAGARPILVRTGNRKATRRSAAATPEAEVHAEVHDDLAAAVDALLAVD